METLIERAQEAIETVDTRAQIGSSSRKRLRVEGSSLEHRREQWQKIDSPYVK